MPVLSLVSASIPPEHRDEVSRAYSAAIERGLPVGIRETFLLLGETRDLRAEVAGTARDQELHREPRPNRR